MTVGLPILQGRDNASFMDLQRRERALMLEVQALSAGDLEKTELLTFNSKTGPSFDFPVGQTCTPTRECATVCYAKRQGSPLLWRVSLLKRLRNLQYVLVTEPAKVVKKLAREFERRFQTAATTTDVEYPRFLRLLGTGDLFTELVPVINEFTRLKPDVLIWIPTRKFGLAQQIEIHPNTRLRLSLDASTPAEDLAQAKELLAAKGPQVQTTFLRTRFGDDVTGASVVYPAHDVLASNPKIDCPVDAGRLALGKRGKDGQACAQCRRCFQSTADQDRGWPGHE